MNEARSPDPRVLDLIAAYGADPQAWPEDERAFAEAAIAEQPDLYDIALADAGLLDDALRLETAPEPSIALIEDVLRAAPKPASALRKPRTWGLQALFPNGVRWPAGAALASLSMGIVGGYAYAATAPQTYTEAEAVYFEAFGYDTYETWLTQEPLQ